MRTPKQKQQIQIWTVIFFRAILMLLGLIALFFYVVPWLFLTLKNVLLMLVVSVFFCYLIAPLVRVVEQPIYVAGRELKLPRIGAIAVVYLLVGTVMFVALRLLLPVLWVQLADLARNLPDYATNSVTSVQRMMDGASSLLQRLRVPPEWRDRIIANLTSLAETYPGELGSVITGILNSLVYATWLVLVPILSFFMLKDADRFTKGVVALMPTERLQKRAYWLLLDVSRTLAGYIRAQITACVVVGTIVTIGFLIIGVPYAVVLGVISGVLEFIPMVGPLVATVVSIGLTLTESFKLALGVAAFLAVFRIVQDYVIYPRIVGQGIKMHPLMVVLAILCGEKIGGLTGIFLAIPVVGLIIVFYNHYLAYRALSAQVSEATLTPSTVLREEEAVPG